MTENDEGAVRAILDLLYEHAHGDYESSAKMLAVAIRAGRIPGIELSHSDQVRSARILNEQMAALRSQLAAAESKSLAVHEVLGKERDQAIARLGEARGLMIRAITCIRFNVERGSGKPSDDIRELITQMDEHLSRDSAGGIS
jgi:hypothetical protein